MKVQKIKREGKNKNRKKKRNVKTDKGKIWTKK